MYATITPTRSTVFAAIRSFLLGSIDCEVVQGRDNLVAPLITGIVITPLFEKRLSTNEHDYHDTQDLHGVDNGTVDTNQSMELTLQIDCYGPESSSWANIITTLWRDEYAYDAMGADVKPIDADDPKPIEFVDPSEHGYVERWMLTATVQYNPTVTTSMQFFDTAATPYLVAADLL